MRRLPSNRTEKQNRIINAVQDWFGELNPQESKSAVQIALWIMGRKSRVMLSEEEESIALCVGQNLSSESPQTT